MSSSNHTLFDLSYISNMAMGNDAFIVDVINLFLTESPLILEDMIKASHEADYQLLRTRAHKLKSSLKVMGSEELHEKVYWIEQNAMNRQQRLAVDQMLQNVQERMNLLIMQLQQHKSAA